MPQRIQRKRTKGFRLPDDAVCVGRGSPWGNPFTSADSFKLWLETGAVSADLLKPAEREELDSRRRWIRENIASLQGRTLACWCPSGADCHGDVLLHLAASAGVLDAEQIRNIRDLRGLGVPWERVAVAVGASEHDCRRAIGAPIPGPPDPRPVLPWEARQLELFDRQPRLGRTSER